MSVLQQPCCCHGFGQAWINRLLQILVSMLYFNFLHKSQKLKVQTCMSFSPLQGGV